MGYFVAGDDGYYAFWPEEKTRGYYDEGLLYGLADLLVEVNAEWHEQVMNDPNIGLRNNNLQQGESL